MKTLTLSHSSLRDWQVCPRLFELRYVRRLEMGGGCGAAAALGTAFHAALSAWHRHRRLSLALGALRAAWPPDADQPPSWGEQVLTEYTRSYQPDPDAAKVLFAERSFCADLGTVEGPQGPVLVRFAGTLDLLCQDVFGKPFILDHKTSSLGFQLWLADQRVSDQWPAYRLGAQALLGLTVDRVVINYLCMRKGEAQRFQRATLMLGDEEQVAWQAETLLCAQQMLGSFAAQRWPLFRASCTRQWGRACQFYDLCVLPQGSREKFLRECGDIRPRPAGPTEQKQPLGLAEASPAKKKGRK